MSTDENPTRTALRAELGLLPRRSTPAGRLSPASPSHASLLDALAQLPALGRATAGIVRVDADGRVALGDVADELSWGASPQPLVAHADQRTRRLWLTPEPEVCDHPHCADHDPPDAPAATFAPWPKPAAMQSKRRLKLDRSLWAVVHAAPGDGLIVAVAVPGRDALLLTALAPLVAGLLTDVKDADVAWASPREVAA